MVRYQSMLISLKQLTRCQSTWALSYNFLFFFFFNSRGSPLRGRPFYGFIHVTSKPMITPKRLHIKHVLTESLELKLSPWHSTVNSYSMALLLLRKSVVLSWVMLWFLIINHLLLEGRRGQESSTVVGVGQTSY